jgi:hypothetical protein
MSINEPVDGALLPDFSGSEGALAPRLTSARRKQEQQLPGILQAIDAGLGPSGRTALVCCVALALGCAVWAAASGIAYAVSAAIGYCTLAAGVCLYVALVVMSKQAIPAGPATPQVSTSMAAWRLVSRLRVSDASRLWCGIEPGCPATQDSLAWSRALLDAIKQGDLPFTPKAGDGKDVLDRERANPSWCTEIDRSALVVWANKHGHAPSFLQE